MCCDKCPLSTKKMLVFCLGFFFFYSHSSDFVYKAFCSIPRNRDYFTEKLVSYQFRDCKNNHHGNRQERRNKWAKQRYEQEKQGGDDCHDPFISFGTLPHRVSIV